MDFDLFKEKVRGRFLSGRWLEYTLAALNLPEKILPEKVPNRHFRLTVDGEVLSNFSSLCVTWSLWQVLTES